MTNILQKQPKSYIVLAIMACVLWSTAFVGIKIGLKYTPPLQFAGIRFIIAGLMILPFVGVKRLISEARANKKILIKVTLLQTVVHYTLFYLGIERIPSAVGAILIGSGPLFITVAAHFGMKDDKMSTGKLIGLLIGFLGVILVSIGTKSASSPEAASTVLIGVCCLIGVNINSSYTNIILKKSSGIVSPLVLSSGSMLFGGIIIFTYSLFIEDFKGFIFPKEYYFSLLWLAFLSAAAVSMWFTAMHRDGVKISNLNMWKFIIPTVGAGLSWILLPEESPDLITILGVLITALSLLWINYYNRKFAS